MEKFFIKESLLDTMYTLNKKANISDKDYRLYMLNEKTKISVRTSVRGIRLQHYYKQRGIG